MQELDTIDLPDGRHGTVVYVSLDASMIIIEVGSELIDYTIEENSLKELGRMTVGPEDLSNRLVGGQKAAN
jgi:hypothetical protein